ncbi:MAG: DMT family transporter [Raoultibacter sp.]
MMAARIRALSGLGHNKLFGHFAVAVAVLVWGSTFAASKYVMEAGVSPLEMLIVRFAIAWLILQLIPSAKLGFHGWRRELPFVAAALGGVTFYFALENIAVSLTYASDVGLITGINPLFTAAVFWLFYRERPSKWFFVGGVLAVFGVVCVAKNGAQLQGDLRGDFLAVLACLSWSFYTLSMRKIKELPFEKDDIAITRRIFFWGVITSCCLIAFSGTFDFLRVGTPLAVWLSPEVIFPMLYLAAFASCLCFVANNFGMRVLGEVAATTYIYLLPAVSLLASHVILGEAITPLAIVGMGAITIGLLISEEFWKWRLKST